MGDLGWGGVQPPLSPEPQVRGPYDLPAARAAEEQALRDRAFPGGERSLAQLLMQDGGQALRNGFTNGAKSFGDQAMAMLRGQAAPQPYAGGTTANQYVSQNWPAMAEQGRASLSDMTSRGRSAADQDRSIATRLSAASPAQPLSLDRRDVVDFLRTLQR